VRHLLRSPERAPSAARAVVSWRLRGAFARAVLLTAIILLGALLLGRTDAAVLAAPFGIAAALAAVRRPAGGAELSVDVRLSADTTMEGAPVRVAVAVHSDVDLDAAILGMRVDPALRVRAGDDLRVLAVSAGVPRDVTLDLVAARWGRRTVGPARVQGMGAGLLLGCDAVTTGPAHLRVLPGAETYRSAAPLPYAVIASGTHASALRGEGTDLAGVRPFVPGDRPRRVNWKVSQRRGELHVVEAFPERASEIVVLLDSGQDVGGSSSSPSSLDVAVRAAAGLAEHHLSRGDGVRMLDVGERVRALHRVSGRRAFVSVLDWLLDAPMVAAGFAWGPTEVGRLVPPRALVVVLSPLLDERVTALVAALRQRGQPLVLVDTLPAGSLPRPESTIDDLAQRLWRLEREAVVARLAEVGTPVVPWSGTGSLDPVVREVTRMAAAPRAAYQ
jgi:uncharacterized protein (DUF58 family)